MTSIEKNAFRHVMGEFATGITIVTTSSRDGIVGITVNSFCSVSLDPPLVLICIDLKSTALQYFRESDSFVVNILSDQQEYLSRCFAIPSEERYNHFCHVSYHLTVTGSPIIKDVLAYVEARILEEYPGGDHAIFIGQVEAMGIGSQVIVTDDVRECSNHYESTEKDDKAKPLAYFRGQYRHLTSDYRRPSLATQYDEKGYLKVR